MHRADEAGYPEIRVGKINLSPFLNTDLRNFTWATNGGKTHTVDSAKMVYERLEKVDANGLSSVEFELKQMGLEYSKGRFFK